jgi:hypothetical protein
MSDRETQFQGFAKLLTDELIKYLTSRAGLTLDEIEQEWHEVIARRAYDLVCHAQADPKDLDVLGLEEAIQRIPDMTELPKERYGH